jgi:hypothetical protein
VQQEIETLADACRDLGVALEIETAIATTERIGYLFATTRQPFDVLHFSGHGSRHLDGSSVLALEDETGVVRDLNAAELRRLIGNQPCRLAFLSACHSAGLADALLAAGVRHVVAINAADPVLDLAARVCLQCASTPHCSPGVQSPRRLPPGAPLWQPTTSCGSGAILKHFRP